VIKRLRSINGRLISALDRVTYCEGISVGLGFPEDGVGKYRNASERILRVAREVMETDVSWSVKVECMVRVCLWIYLSN